MKKRLKVGILFGGKSAEHEISLQSARNIFASLNPQKYEVRLIGITKQGMWCTLKNQQLLAGNSGGMLPALTKHSALLVAPEVGIRGVDIIFPVLHGPMGEDGTVQGLLKTLNIPFVGADVLGSAVGMDKDVMKRLLRDANIPVAEFLVFYRGSTINPMHVQKTLGMPVFVKPANLGSSIGVTKVRSTSALPDAMRLAYNFDNKILIEKSIAGREIECSVLGNEICTASIPGEIIPRHEFYSYEAKYLDPEGAELKVPAQLSQQLIKRVQKLAIHACEVLCIEGMARVDFFLQKNGALLVNEVNTIPGFTAISMYPKLWAASGMSQEQLVDRLIALAFERCRRDKKLSTSNEGGPHLQSR